MHSILALTLRSLFLAVSRPPFMSVHGHHIMLTIVIMHGPLCAQDDHSLEEERRLLYVATTRARHQVVLVHATQRMRWGKRSFNPPSQFLEAVPHELAPRSSASPPPLARWRAR